MDVPMCFHGGVAHGTKKTYLDLTSVPDVMTEIDSARGATLYRLGEWDTGNQCWSYHAEEKPS